MIRLWQNLFRGRPTPVMDAHLEAFELLNVQGRALGLKIEKTTEALVARANGSLAVRGVLNGKK